MSQVRELIRAKIAERRLSMKELSTGVLGKNHAYLQQFLERGIPLRLPEDARARLATALGVSEADLKEPANHGGKGSIADRHTPATIPPGDDKLKVLGMAEGGPDGWSLWNGDVIDWIDRPANLRGVRDAYAVYVTGSSMEPRYHPGELAHIHPHKPITIGAYVLVQKKPKGPGEPPLAVIKRLVKRSGNRVVLEQTSPAKTFEIRADEIVSMHRVVGSSEA